MKGLNVTIEDIVQTWVQLLTLLTTFVEQNPQLATQSVQQIIGSPVNQRFSSLGPMEQFINPVQQFSASPQTQFLASNHEANPMEILSSLMGLVNQPQSASNQGQFDATASQLGQSLNPQMFSQVFESVNGLSKLMAQVNAAQAAKPGLNSQTAIGGLGGGAYTPRTVQSWTASHPSWTTGRPSWTGPQWRVARTENEENEVPEWFNIEGLPDKVDMLQTNFKTELRSSHLAPSVIPREPFRQKTVQRWTPPSFESRTVQSVWTTTPQPLMNSDATPEWYNIKRLPDAVDTTRMSFATELQSSAPSRPGSSAWGREPFKPPNVKSWTQWTTPRPGVEDERLEFERELGLVSRPEEKVQVRERLATRGPSHGRDDKQKKLFRVRNQGQRSPLIDLQFPLQRLTTTLPDDPNHFEVLVIGAGMAGVTAAYTIGEDTNFRKHRVALLEANSRVGGRILNTTSPSGQNLELGAQYVIGVDNPIYKLAMQYNLIDTRKVFDFSSYLTNLSPKSYFGSRMFGQEVTYDLVADCQRVYDMYYYAYNATTDPSGRVSRKYSNSLGEYMNEMISNYLRGQRSKRSVKRAIFQNIAAYAAVRERTPSSLDINLREGSYEEIPGGNFMLRSAYVELLNVLLDYSKESLRKKDSSLAFFANHEVVSIRQSKTLYDAVEVFCSNGAKFTAEHVLVTVPLSVLKAKQNTMFEPRLPTEKVHALAALEMGIAEKIFLEFQEQITGQFVGPDVEQIFLFWEDGRHADSPVEEPKVRTSSVDSKNWFHGVRMFYVLSPNLLMAWVTGEEALYAQSIDAKEVGRTLTNVLRQFLRRPDLPEPSSTTVTGWATREEFVQGTSMFLPPRASKKDITNLCRPIYENGRPSILFAGEACSKEHHSTTHGALLSGEEAAIAVLKHIKESSSSGQSRLGK